MTGTSPGPVHRARAGSGSYYLLLDVLHTSVAANRRPFAAKGLGWIAQVPFYLESMANYGMCNAIRVSHSTELLRPDAGLRL